MSLVSGTADSIAAILTAVPNIGLVYKYDPFPSGDWASFVDEFTTTISGIEQVRAWTIKNIGRVTEPGTMSIGSEVQRPSLSWLIRGFLVVKNVATSDVTFRDLLEAVTEALNTKRGLGGAPSILDHDLADYSLPNNGELRLLGDVVCHYGEVTFTSHHEITVATTL